MAARFGTVFLFWITLHASHNSLLSRFRNPNEIVAPEDTLELEELDPASYEDLLEEVPELRGFLKRPPSRDPLRMPYLKANLEQSDEYDFMVKGVELAANVTDATSTTLNVRRVTESSTTRSTVTVVGDALPLAAPRENVSDARRWHWSWAWRYYWKGPKVATCYRCGVESSARVVPLSPVCHDAWESPDWRARTMTRFFRARCYKNKYHWGCRPEEKRIFGRLHKWDRGLIRGCYGMYSGGCFKRFLDVGKVYTSRGCRSWLPLGGNGFAGHRFRKLEYLLRGRKEGCVVSPHASLTPFSRAVSLYVRYHVCVCNTKYCNSAATTSLAAALLAMLLITHLGL